MIVGGHCSSGGGACSAVHSVTAHHMEHSSALMLDSARRTPLLPTPAAVSTARRPHKHRHYRKRRGSRGTSTAVELNARGGDCHPKWTRRCFRNPTLSRLCPPQPPVRRSVPQRPIYHRPYCHNDTSECLGGAILAMDGDWRSRWHATLTSRQFHGRRTVGTALRHARSLGRRTKTGRAQRLKMRILKAEYGARGSPAAW